MSNLKTRFVMLLVFFTALSCGPDESPELQDIKDDVIRYVTAEDIPSIISKINQTLNLRGGQLNSSYNGEIATSIGNIDMDNIMEVIDTLENTNYTFSIEDGDENPFTFSNLIVKKRESGSIDTPFLLNYTVDSAYVSEFINGGFSMESFTGVLVKEYLINNTQNTRNSANLDDGVKYSAGNPCSDIAEFTSGTGVWWNPPITSGDGAEGPGSGDGPGGGGGPQYGWVCTTVSFEERDDPSCTQPSDGNHQDWAGNEGSMEWLDCPTTTVYRTNCQYEIINQNQSGGSDCASAEAETIGVIPNFNSATVFLSNYLALDANQIGWLQANPDAALDYASFVMEEGEWNEDGTLSEATMAASRIAIELERTGNSTNTSSSGYTNALQSGLNCCEGFISFVPSMAPQVAAAHFGHYAVLKQENPTWSNRKLHWHAFKDVLHTGFDVMGLVPGFGEVFDFANATIYALEGDWGNASLSIVATIPFVGWTSTTAKWAKRAHTLSNGNKVILSMYKTAEGIKFSYRGQLRKALEIATFSSKRAHHVIPWQFNNHPVIQAAAASSKGWHPNDVLNGLAVSKARHAGSHSAYSNFVQQELEQIRLSLGGSNIDPEQAYDRILVLANQLKGAIEANPNKIINDIFP